MKYALIITGLLAALAIAAPTLVVVGYFFLIIPGLILTIAPSVFVYLVVAAMVRRLLPMSTSVAATATAFCVAILLGWAVMQPFRMAAITQYEAHRLLDVTPPRPIKLDGHVRLEMLDRRENPKCDHLCLAVLDSPGVQSITAVTVGRDKQSDGLRSDAYALVSAQANSTAGIFPYEAGQIVREFGPLIQMYPRVKLRKAAKAVEANWAIRLTQHERLRNVAPVAADDADWVIRIENQANARQSTLRRLTIVDSNGTVRFRKTYRKQYVPARMFYIGFRLHGGGGTISGASFQFGQQRLEAGERSLKPESALLSAIEFPLPRCDPTALIQLRDQVEQALDDPEATAVRLDLARQFLGLFFFDAAPHDHALIARILADDRVSNIDEQIKNVFSKDKTPLAMRESYAQRITMDHTSASLRRRLAEGLASLPAGTFADPNESHLKIWESPEIYQDAAPFIGNLSDLDPQRAMPMLEAALTTAIELPTWQERRALIDGIRVALIRLGPQASAATPRIRELFLRRPSPILKSAKDADQWRLALTRMGVEIQELPVFPNQSSESVEKAHRRVADKLRRYEQAPKDDP
ncbi:hypothetical protein Pla52o_15110 [Novipirellula galeiformis]|uniref:Uncharacterized protein n=1 Tax=Novipirellula galeiformis TaxID=2528004 RepID=A0A5C6CK17_9BACT|nr:hypothetical protein [Novipirellula galeiformis]TWU25213.1 hypothetical protein Pla52o_15110 [Novipirellula galeiformis]